MSPGDLLRSSSFRLSLLYMSVFAGSVLLLLGFIYWSTVAFMAQQTDSTIDADIQGLSEQYRERGLDGLVATINQRLARDPDSSSVYLLTSPQYRFLSGNLSAWPDVARDADGWLSFEFKDPRAGGRVFQARARPFVLEQGLHLLVGRDIRELRATQALIVRALLWGTGITLLLAVVGGVVLSRSTLRRIERINQASRKIMNGDLTRRIPVDQRSDEFGQLAINLNAMLDEIERLMEGVRHVSDNVAHDLRTPLTRLRNRLEGLRTAMDQGHPLRETVDRSLEETDQLLQTFGALLRIARLEAGVGKSIRETVDLATLLVDAFDLYEAVADERGLVLRLQLADASSVAGDRDLLFQAVVNLLDNAIEYTPSGGIVTLGLADVDGYVALWVADDGPGIPPAEREKVLQRFYRLESSRSTPGSGLGLSLVAAVAGDHDAELCIDDNRPGLKISLRFSKPPPAGDGQGR